MSDLRVEPTGYGGFYVTTPGGKQFYMRAEGSDTLNIVSNNGAVSVEPVASNDLNIRSRGWG